MYSLLIVTVAMWGYSCGDSSTGNDDEDNEAIVGTWLSQGATHVALGLQQLTKTAKIDAVFEANATYSVIATDSTGAEVTYEGTYVLGEETVSGTRTITLTQTAPTSVTSAGIYEINGTTLMYEVIQTSPDIGATAPNTDDGFGSTLVGGVSYGTYWTQTFVKQ